MTNLNDQQIAAVNHPLKPLLILAGAGTGKTTTIIERAAKLIKHHNIDPKSILALTFTIDAADNLKNKLVAKIGEEGQNISACTFHSFAQNITMEYYKELGYTKRPSIINNIDIFYLLRERFNDLINIESRLIGLNPIKSISSFQKVYNSLRQNLLDNNNLLKLCSTDLKNAIKNNEDNSKIEKLYQLSDILKNYNYFQKLKKDRNWVDYADLISNLWILISKKSIILNTLQDKYKHVIIDEFQDNNYALSLIVDKISYPQNSITVVGDDDQCIYAFRQANFLNIEEFKNKHLDENNKSINLIQNYRSVLPILNVANDVISKNKNRMNKDLLYSDLQSEELPKLYIGNKNIQLIKLKEEIKALLDNGEKPDSIAVLLRTNKKCEEVSLYFKNSGINTSYISLKLFEQSFIKDIVALINIYFKSNKQVHAFIRLLKKNTDININKYLKNYHSSKNKHNFIDHALSINDKLQLIAKDILLPVYKLKINDVNVLVWELIKILSPYKSIDNKKSMNFMILKESLSQFRELVILFSKNYSKYTSNDFLEFINLQLEVNEIYIDLGDNVFHNSGIKVMTVHASKGLEFKHVFLPFLSSGTFPIVYKQDPLVQDLPMSWQRWMIDKLDPKEMHYEEERRLFYVAITRAMNTLKLFTTNKRQSMFIKELNPNLIIKEDIDIEELELTKIEKLIGSFKSQIALELGLNNFNEVSNLIDAIKNIELISEGKKPQWNNNSYKNIVEKTLINTDKIIEHKNKITLSASRISVYNECPLKYKFAYLDNIPQSPSPVSSQLGILIHKVLEIYHKGNYSNISDLILLLNNEWDDEHYKFKKQNYQEKIDAENMLHNYWNFIQENPVNIISAEHDFSFETEHAIVNGKCDRIDYDDNCNFSIYDYKTSKTFKTEAALKKDVQLGIYAYFIFKEGIIIEGQNVKKNPQKVSMIYLRKESPEVSITFNDEELKYIIKQVDETASAIKRKEFKACEGMHCDWCDFKNLICPQYG